MAEQGGKPTGDGVPFVDLTAAGAPSRSEIEAALADVLDRGDFIGGGAVGEFEREFADYVGVAAAIGTGSGTAALQIAVRALGIEAGEEVIVPAHTFIASALGPLHAGAVPVFCDVEPETGLIDLESAADAVGKRTAAVVAVHLYGQPCDLSALEAFCERHGLALIEDAAQAHGASWDGRRCGAAGAASAFSFYPSKNLGAFGDGGLITTSDPAVERAARGWGNLGQLRKGEHALPGLNERLDTLQAAVLAAKLPHLDAANASRRAAAARYRELLPEGVRRLPARERAEDVHHLFPIRVPDPAGLAAALAGRGIGTGFHYTPAVHRQPPFAAAGGGQSFPAAEAWAASELSLPIFAGMGDEQVERVCAALAECEELLGEGTGGDQR